MHRLSYCLVLSLSLVACGGEDTSNNTNNNSVPLDWPNLDAAAKGAHMGSVVLPRMTVVLQEFDPQAYADVTCDTCHGPNGQASGFVMPNPNLPPLPADPTPVFTSSPAVAGFMASKVVPEMAALLELTPVDPATGQGEFGCFNCHTVE